MTKCDIYSDGRCRHAVVSPILPILFLELYLFYLLIFALIKREVHFEMTIVSYKCNGIYLVRIL